MLQPNYAAQGKAPRILIVEDYGLTQLQISRTLILSGYDVVGKARTGSEAIVLAEDLMPDIILMDVNLPGSIDGIDATSRIMKNTVAYCPIIIIVTAYNEPDLVEQATRAGALRYLLKPLTSEQLLASIQCCLTEKEVKQTGQSVECL